MRGHSALPGFLVLIGHMVAREPQACHRQLPRLTASGLWHPRSTWPQYVGMQAALARGSHDWAVTTNWFGFASWRLCAIETTGAWRASSHAARSGQG